MLTAKEARGLSRSDIHPSLALIEKQIIKKAKGLGRFILVNELSGMNREILTKKGYEVTPHGDPIQTYSISW